MAFDTKNLVLHIRRLLFSSIRLGYLSACDYPVVLGGGIVLLFLHELCPSVFTFVLSSSPVLILTALLLGAILSYGEPTVPLIGEQTLENQETLSRKSNISITAYSISEGENNVTVDARLHERIDRVEIHVGERASNDHGHDTPSEEKNVTYMVADTVLTEEVYGKRTSSDSTHDTDCQEKNITFTADDTVANGESFKYGKTNVTVERENHAEEISEKAELQELEGTYTSSGNYGVMHNQYQLGEFMRSCWQPVIRQDIPCSNSEYYLSDDSSSPDASMTDIIPMLEELHPLIDLGTGHPSLAFRDNFSSSSDNNEDCLEEEDVSSDEEATEGQEDGEHNWKDVDLNSLDMEKSIKPDNLLDIQRAKNILRFELDKKLMDSQAADATQKLKEASSFHVQVPSISTPRQNPYDASKDSEETIELPQIPDSAPSLLCPRQNMFDLPFDRVVNRERFRESWVPRLYLQARQHRKHRNSYGQQHSIYLQHHNGFKLERGEISGEYACDGCSDNEAEHEGIDGKLFGSLEAHLGEEIKILSAAISDVGVLEVSYGVDEGNKIANISDDAHVSPVMKFICSASEAKDSVHAGNEQSILCSKPEVNNSEPHVIEADSMSEVNSLFKCRMDKVLVQSISEPSISQPLTVKHEDELSGSLSSDSGMDAAEASSVEELNSWFAQLNEEALTHAASDSNLPNDNESSIRNRPNEALHAVNEHISELPIEDASRELLTTVYQQTADIPEAISDSVLYEQTFAKLEIEPNEPSSSYAEVHLPEANSVEEVNSLFKQLEEEAQLSNGDCKMSMSQGCELELDAVKLDSGLQVNHAETLDGMSDNGFEVTKLKICTEQAESAAAECVRVWTRGFCPSATCQKICGGESRRFGAQWIYMAYLCIYIHEWMFEQLFHVCLNSK